ncbi:MAG TPA: hypothetical protein VIT65_11970 [Microlunatus sp.]
MSTSTLEATESDTCWPDDDAASDDSGSQHERTNVQQPARHDHHEAESHSKSRPSPPRRRRPATSEVDRATVRRVLERRAALASLSGSDLEVVAGLLGVEADVEAITESSLVGGKAATTAALRDLRQLAESESDMDALLGAIEMGPERVRALGGLVASLSGVGATRLHASHAKAARQVVVLVRGLDPQVLGRIMGLSALLG